MPPTKAKLIAVIEFLEWTLDNHRRHPKFVALCVERVARKITREHRKVKHGIGVVRVGGSLIVKSDEIET